MAFIDQRQLLVTIEGLTGDFWAQLTGGDISVPNAKAYDGGNPRPQLVYGNPVVDDLVCTRNYDPLSHGPILQQLKAGISSGKPFSTTISQSPADPSYTPLSGPPDSWQGVLTKVMTPKADAIKSGANPATFALTFTCITLT